MFIPFALRRDACFASLLSSHLLTYKYRLLTAYTPSSPRTRDQSIDIEIHRIPARGSVNDTPKKKCQHRPSSTRPPAQRQLDLRRPAAQRGRRRALVPVLAHRERRRHGRARRERRGHGGGVPERAGRAQARDLGAQREAHARRRRRRGRARRGRGRAHGGGRARVELGPAGALAVRFCARVRSFVRSFVRSSVSVR